MTDQSARILASLRNLVATLDAAMSDSAECPGCCPRWNDEGLYHEPGCPVAAAI